MASKSKDDLSQGQGSLWDDAYEELRQNPEKRKLLETYEKVLLSDLRSGVTNPAAIQAYKDANTKSKRDQMSQVVTRKVDAVEEARTKWRLRSKDIEVSRKFEKAVELVLSAKDVISKAVSAEPHAAVAWAGVCVVLPLLLNHSLQRDAAIEGVAAISAIICRSKLIDETHEKIRLSSLNVHKLSVELATKRKVLYTKILEYEARIVCHFSGSKVAQVTRDILKPDPWKPMLDEIMKQDELCEKDMVALQGNEIIIGIQRLNMSFDQVEQQTAKNKQAAGNSLGQWLSTIDSHNRHLDIRRPRLEGSGLWLFSKTEYIAWSSSTKPCTLWILGGIGIGKSVLVSSIVDELLMTSQVPLGYFYCDSRSQTKDIVGSILYQLVSSTSIDSSKRTVYEDLVKIKEEGRSNGLSVEECQQFIISAMKNNLATNIVIDGLDELNQSCRAELLRFLGRLKQEAKTLLFQLKVVLSGRHDLNVKPNSDSTQILRLSNNDSEVDLKRFVEAEVGENSASNVLLGGALSEELKTRIISALLSGADGMFQWAKVQMNLLCDSTVIRDAVDIDDRLKSLPRDLDQLYRQIMDEKLEQLPPRKSKLVRRAFAWLLAAQCELSVPEFLAAVCVDKTGSADNVTPEDLTGYSCSLILLDHATDRFRIAHASIEEYLRRRDDFNEQTTNTIAAERCITFWLAKDPASKVAAGYENNHHFTNYATKFLVHHLDCAWQHQEVITMYNDHFQRFFSPPTRLRPPKAFSEWITSIWFYSGRYDSNYRFLRHFIPLDPPGGSKTLGNGVPPWSKFEMKAAILFAAAYFGLLEVLKATILSVATTTYCNANGHTAAQLAALRGNFGAVCLLLDETVVSELLALVDTTRILCACPGSHVIGLHRDDSGHDNASIEDVGTESLRRSGLSIMLADAIGQAAEMGHTAIVRWLLDKGACSNTLMQYEVGVATILFGAVQNGHEKVSELLVDRGADVAARTYDCSLSDPIDAAAAKENIVILEYLLQEPADVSFCQALSTAATVGNILCFELLLEQDFPQSSQEAAFLTACEFGHHEIIRLLIENNDLIQFGVKDNFAAVIKTVKGNVSASSKDGSPKILRTLLDNGVDVNQMASGYIEYDLSIAEFIISERKTELFAVLLDAGLDSSEWDLRRLLREVIDLHRNIEDYSDGSKDLDFAQMLFEKLPLLADDFRRDKQFSSIYLEEAVTCAKSLFRTRTSWVIKFARFFLEKGADPDRCIIQAIKTTNVEMIRTLLEFGGTIAPPGWSSQSTSTMKPNQETLVDLTDPEFFIHLAVTRANELNCTTSVVEFLIDLGSDVWRSSPAGIPLQHFVLNYRDVMERREHTAHPRRKNKLHDLWEFFGETTRLPLPNLELSFDEEEGNFYYRDTVRDKVILAHRFSGYPETWQHAWTTTGQKILVDPDTRNAIWRNSKGNHIAALIEMEEDGETSQRFLDPQTMTKHVIRNGSVLEPPTNPIATLWVDSEKPCTEEFETWRQAGYELTRWS